MSMSRFDFIDNIDIEDILGNYGHIILNKNFLKNAKLIYIASSNLIYIQ